VRAELFRVITFQLARETSNRTYPEIGVSDPAGTLADLRAFRYAPGLSKADAIKLLMNVEDNTGKKIRYFAADVRMLAYDNPQSPSIEQSSIFYAPVFLADKNPAAARAYYQPLVDGIIANWSEAVEPIENEAK